MDYAQIQDDEVETVKALYFVEGEFEDLTPGTSAWNQRPLPVFNLHLSTSEVKVCLHVAMTPTYPATLPTISILSLSLHKDTLRGLQKLIDSVCAAHKGLEMVLVVADEVRTRLDEIEQERNGTGSLEQERQERIEKQEAMVRAKEREEEQAQLDQAQQTYRQVAGLVKGREVSEDVPAELPVLLPPASTPHVVFDSVITDTHNGHLLRFQAVTGLVPTTTSDLLGHIGRQYAVQPHVDCATPPEYLLTVVELRNPHWSTPDGRHELQQLEAQLLAVSRITDLLVARLYAFEVKRTSDLRWEVSLLTPPLPMGTVNDLLLVVGLTLLATARSWMLQIVYALQGLFQHGLTHKFVNSHTVQMVRNADVGLVGVRLAHPVYGSGLINMLNRHPSSEARAEHIDLAIGPGWRAPELSKHNGKDNHTRKTDVWELGVLFVEMIGGVKVLQDYATPQDLVEAQVLVPSVSTLLGYMFRPESKRRVDVLELIHMRLFRESVGQEEQAFVSEEPVRPRARRLLGMPQSTGSARPPDGRFHKDFEDFGTLGSGAYGKVIKARGRMDGNFYAVKMIRNVTDPTVLAEVAFLLKLNHQYIVRYYNLWLEEGGLRVHSELEEDTLEEDTLEDDTLEGFLADTRSFSVSHPLTSFEYVLNLLASDPFVFGSADASQQVSLEGSPCPARQPPSHPQTLYIQMEYCERNTLADLIAQGLPRQPDEYWRLLRQVLEALAYIHGQGVVHRDLKPANIFIDQLNNIKMGDFGLAKNVAGALLPFQLPADEALLGEVGTALYVAPEVGDGTRAYGAKVDMYLLGIIFFEMCWAMGTGMERVLTIRELRKQTVAFPHGFSSKHSPEHKLLAKLLTHDPSARPDATEVLQLGFVPVHHQDELIREALRLLANPQLPWQPQVRKTLFAQPYLLVEDVVFEQLAVHHTTQLDQLLHEQLLAQVTAVFVRHGGVAADTRLPPVFPRLPLYTLFLQQPLYEVLDALGAVLQLPHDLTIPLARQLSAHGFDGVHKRYRFGQVFRPPSTPGAAPYTLGEIDFDIVLLEQADRPFHDAECLKVMDEVVALTPCYSAANTTIVLNHSGILELVMEFCGVDKMVRPALAQHLAHTTRTTHETKVLLQKQLGVGSATFAQLSSFHWQCTVDQADGKLAKAFKDWPGFYRVEEALGYLAKVAAFCKQLGVVLPIVVAPWSSYNFGVYRGGSMFQVLATESVRVANTTKERAVYIAGGGRYDSLVERMAIARGRPHKVPSAVGFHIAWDPFVERMKREHQRVRRSGVVGVRDALVAPPSRCDVLVVSLLPQGRSMAVTALTRLWAAGLRADLVSTSLLLEEVMAQASADGASHVVVVKQQQSLHISVKSRKTYKPLRVKHLESGREVDVDVDDVGEVLRAEVCAKREVVETVAVAEEPAPADDSPIITVQPRCIEVPNEATGSRRKGRAKKDRWAVEAAAGAAQRELLQVLAQAPVFLIDTRDELLDMMGITSLDNPEEWRRKVGGAHNNTPRSFVQNMYAALAKERARGTKWAVVYLPKTGKTVVCDLER